MKQIHLDSLPYQSVSHNSAIKKKVILKASELAHVTNFAQAYFEPGQIADSHAHPDMNEVFFVVSGCGEILVDDILYPLRTGSCIVVEAGEFHEVRNSGDELLILNYFGVVTGNTSPRSLNLK